MIRAFILSALLTALALAAPAQDKPKKPSVGDLAWFSGCWKQQKDGNRYTIEQWSKPAGMMIGTVRSYRDGRITAYEFLRIIEKEGDIYFVAIPSGQEEAAFKLTSLKDGEAVFENPEHDFPQRLVYKKAGEDGLTARVEATKDGKETGFDVIYNKTNCND